MGWGVGRVCPLTTEERVWGGGFNFSGTQLASMRWAP